MRRKWSGGYIGRKTTSLNAMSGTYVHTSCDFFSENASHARSSKSTTRVAPATRENMNFSGHNKAK